eukprot:CAMPEP_0176416888 /NCGR_PEP_ID=MMETSP0127-20121128/6587_1 /TAXON_ID=938130 /ORGANISM="Platyophrya macrostoma, Strain WH" /LENGTH=655 /DNA_ID=CAMNT_0017796995 /DNA_START=244 /DNA_END=2211 /DNA_ORIENTATION=+
MKEHEEKVVKIKANIKKMSQDNKNACLKDPSTVGNPKEQLQSFVEGDCAPVILMPGLMGTKLMVEIDCKELMQYHPEIMQSCGWSTCAWSLIYRKPDTEYLMWIPDMMSPMAFLTLTNQTCFGSLVRPLYDPTKENVADKYDNPRGIKIKWYGNTQKTQQYADSGFTAISNLFPLPFQTASTVGFAGMDTYLSALGYQKGLSLFAVPYDFRLTHLANSVSYTLERTIRYAYALTGKKVIIAAHSLGNLNTLPVLVGMSQEDKDKMIATYVAITPPLGGASKTVRLSIGGDDGFLYLDQVIGMDFYNQKNMIGGSSSTQDLIPKDGFYRFRNEKWMKDLLERVDMEKNNPASTEKGLNYWKTANPNEIPYSFFPDPTKICFDGFTQRPKECFMGITDLAKEPVAVINNASYYANHSSYIDLLQNHFTLNDIKAIEGMTNDSHSSGVQLMPNPNVPIVYIYGTHLATELKNEWNYCPENLTSVGKYAFPSTIHTGLGDGTVEVSYALTIAMKWAWEHQHDIPNAKPIKIAEYCSSYNQRNTSWDKQDESGANIMTTTEYMGTYCTCLDSKTPGVGADCFHAGILGDTYIIELVSNIAKTKEKVADKENTGAFRITKDLLVELVNTLPHLRKPKEDQDVYKWLYPGGVEIEHGKTITK